MTSRGEEITREGFCPCSVTSIVGETTAVRNLDTQNGRAVLTVPFSTIWTLAITREPYFEKHPTKGRLFPNRRGLGTNLDWGRTTKEADFSERALNREEHLGL